LRVPESGPRPLCLRLSLFQRDEDFEPNHAIGKPTKPSIHVTVPDGRSGGAVASRGCKRVPLITAGRISCISPPARRPAKLVVRYHRTADPRTPTARTSPRRRGCPHERTTFVFRRRLVNAKRSGRVSIPLLNAGLSPTHDGGRGENNIFDTGRGRDETTPAYGVKVVSAHYPNKTPLQNVKTHPHGGRETRRGT